MGWGSLFHIGFVDIICADWWNRCALWESGYFIGQENVFHEQIVLVLFEFKM